ncbi:hypothetical protein IWW38_002666 [Coemansia aciculifera]|uniref:Uncharacterized protein n=1 Tax=Coemansia aciculifera TaxID=417176 RepID=A0ACC1M4E7_9FUNG|nr:hypothetical protein IWW38_002666 [Coemansia aciculifera]
MSLNNLTRSKVDRTSLDDWESLIYLLCWFATRGIEKDNKRNWEELEKLPIAKWRSGNTDAVASSKREHLRSNYSFKRHIVSHFNSKDRHVEYLKALASLLYSTLFENKDAGEHCHGVYEIESSSHSSSITAAEMALLRRNAPPPTTAGDNSAGIVDPFKMRAEKWEQISHQMLDIFAIAMDRIDDWE